MSRIAYIVWNGDCTEGVIFVGPEGQTDATNCVKRRHRGMYSTLGHAFAEEIYDDQKLSLQLIELPALTSSEVE